MTPRSLVSRREMVLLTAAAGLGLAGIRPARAAGVSRVVELFTSQGCSSCPPADKLLQGMAGGSDVLALSWPVDYWDYIGWKDTFASPAFTARQNGYAASRGDGHVYTPQVVVNGLRHAVGSDPDEIRAAEAGTQGKGALSVPISVAVADGQAKIDIGASTGANRAAGVWLLGVRRSGTVAIGRGENAGATVTYTHVVRAVRQAGQWTGASGAFSAALEGVHAGGADSFAVLLQAGSQSRPGVILAASPLVAL